MALNPHQQADVNRARRSSVEQEFNGLPLHWAGGAWLRADNRYRHNCIDRLRKDMGSSRGLRASHLREYISASTVLHCMDGWAYLGRSLASYLSGDIDVARHLAYYAELRAAMSLLGTEGIGIFHNRHICIDAANR